MWRARRRGAATSDPARLSYVQNVYTLAEVQKHNKPDDCWVVVKGEPAFALPAHVLHQPAVTHSSPWRFSLAARLRV